MKKLFNINMKREVWFKKLHKAAPNSVLYMWANQMTEALTSQILWPIRLMESNIGTAYSANRRLLVLLPLLDNGLYKMQCFWRLPFPSKIWRTDASDKEDIFEHR